MEALPFETLFAIAAAAVVISMTVASTMAHRSERRVPARIRRRT